MSGLGIGERRIALTAWHSRDTHRAFWNLPLTLGLMLCVGILLLRGTAVDAKREGFVQNVGALLEEMRRNGYWLHDDIVAYARRAAGEA